MRLPVIVGMIVLFVAGNAIAEEATSVKEPGARKEADDKAWSFAASAYAYLVPDNRNYLQPSFTADHGWLHLELRYNYEDLDTASTWVGYNASGGKALTWEFTPMLGGVLGHTTGVAPGYLGSLKWWRLELSTEGEYVFDTSNAAGNFFYTWSELTASPVDWFRLGLAVQRTKIAHTSLDIQRGFLLGFSYNKKVDLTAYVFNLGWTDPTLVFAMTITFGP